MAGRVRFTDNAIADLEAARDWLTQPGSGSKARRRMAEIAATCKRLGSNPFLYPVGSHPGVREAACADGYRVMYEVSLPPGTSAGDVLVTILRVYGPRQDRTGFGRG